MDAVSQLHAILDWLERYRIDVRREHLGGAGGGMCRLRGKPVVFLDLDADTATQLENCLTVLASLPDAGACYLPPALRERIEEQRRPSAGADDP